MFRAPGGAPAGSSTVLESEGALDLRLATLVTGIDVSPDGAVVALRSYDGVDLYPRPAGRPLWSAFDEQPCAGPHPLEKQGEAIGFAADGGSYATIGEGESPTLHLTRP